MLSDEDRQAIRAEVKAAVDEAVAEALADQDDSAPLQRMARGYTDTDNTDEKAA